MLDLDQDPVPGYPYEVKDLAKTLTGFAEDVGAALRSIRGLSGDTALLDWVGLSGDEFRKQYGDLPKELEKLETSYRMAGSALAAYWPQLEQAQAKADKALQDGRDARAQLSAANTHLSSANGWVTRANAESQKYQQNPQSNTPPPNPADVRAAARNVTDAQQARQAAQSAVSSAQDKLAAAKAMAADAARLQDHAADTCVKSLDDASHAGIQNKHWWQKAVDFVVDHWDDIVAVCKVIVAVLGIVVLIIGGPLAWVLVAAAAVVLTDTLIKYAQGKASLWDVGFAALSCIPMTEGLTSLGGLAQLAKDAPELLRSGDALANMASALRGGGEALEETSATLREGAEDEAAVSKAMEGRCKGGDPIDMISGEMLMSETDVVLPGLLPLVLRRAHLSSYRSGGWFGRSWASTLDERLEADGDGIVFAAEDGMILVYPVPEPGVPVSPSHGPRWSLEWDGTPGAEIRITDPATGHTRHFTPLADEPPGGPFTLPLAAITDRNGHRIEFDRAADGAPVAVRHSGGYHIAVTTVGGRVTELRLLAGDDGPYGTLLRSFAYTDEGDLASVVDSSGKAFRLEYDAEHRIVRWTDRAGSWYRFAYDDAGRCVSGTGADGFLNCQIAYDPEARVNVYTDSLGHTTTYRYNELYQLTERTDALGNTAHSEWDRHNRLVSRTDPLGRRTRCAYDADGNLTTVIRPDETTARVTYNELRRAVEITYPDGAVWRNTWDDHGNLLSTTDPQGAVRGYAYDDRGCLIAVTDATGNTRRLTPDAAGLVVESTDHAGAVTHYERDAFGRVTRITDPLGGVTRISWTIEGKPASRTLPDGTSEHWTYDAEGRLLQHTDPAGGRTRAESTHFDLQASRTAPDDTTLHFTYDTELRLISVQGAHGLTWDYAYDPAGRLVRESDFNGRTLLYEYDSAGQLVERTNGAGQTIRYSRNTMGRVVEQTSDAVVTTFAYDAVGRLLGAANPDAELVMERDAAGRLLNETCNGRVLANEYDLLGRRTLRRTPSGATSTWEWNADSKPAALHSGEHTVDFAYDTAGREIERRIGGMATLTQTWDANHRLTQQELTATTGYPEAPGAQEPGHHRRIHTRGYAYRPDGYLTTIDDSAWGTRTFDLDPCGRPVAVRAQDWSESYTYDPAGNLVHATPPAGTSPDAHGERSVTGTLVHRAGRTHFTYDEQGRIVRRTTKLLSGGDRTWRYTWSAEDRLTDVTTPDGSHWHYHYDPLGRRIAKERLADDGSVLERTDFTWDGSRLTEQYGDDRITTWDWAPGAHRALTQTERTISSDASHDASWKKDLSQDEVDARFYAIVTDLVGTPTELIDTSGTIAWQHRSSLWGETVSGSDGATCPLRFPGQYFDQETGLHYNLFRYYLPDIAGYLSPDPLGLAPAPNHYAYVPNPHTWIDPFGLACGEYVKMYEGGGGVMATLDDGALSMAIEKGAGSPSGGKMFAEVMEHFGPENVTSFQAKWVSAMPTNLDAFNANLRAGMSLEDAAANTFTGHMVGKYGLTSVAVDAQSLVGEFGHYTNVEPVFSRP